VVGAAVQRPDRHHVPSAGLCLGGEHGGGHGGHPGRERHRLGGVLEVGERLLEPGHGRVPQPLVDEAALAGVATGGHRLVRRTAGLDAGQRVGGGEVEREGVHAEVGQVGPAGVDGA